MLYEIKKALVGFRLKLNFDPVLDREKTFVFVDVAQTPTIGSFIQHIRKQFDLEDACFADRLRIELYGCALSPNENVLVLLEVQETRIGVSPKFPSPLPKELSLTEKLSKTIVPTAVSNTDDEAEASTVRRKDEAPSGELLKKKEEAVTIVMSSPHRQKPEIPNFSMDFSKEVVKPSSRSSRSNKTRLYEGVGLMLQKLKSQHFENKEVDKIAEVNDNISDGEVPQSRFVNHKYTNASDDELSNLTCNTDEVDSLIPDKKKRKRKRKHCKKHYKDPEVGVTNAVAIVENVPTTTSSARTHVHFNNENEDDENTTKNNVADGETTKQPAIKRFKDSKKSKLDADSLDLATISNFWSELASHGRVSKTDAAAIATKRSKSGRSSLGVTGSETINSCAASRSISATRNCSRNTFVGPKRKEENSDVSSSSYIIRPSLPFQSRERRCKTISVTEDSDDSEFLPALLMCKQFDTFCEYDVQFAGDERKNKNNVLSVKETVPSKCNPKPLSPPPLPLSSEFTVSDRINSNGNCDTVAAPAAEFPSLEQEENEEEEEEEEECRFLRQFKVEGSTIRMRSANGSWQLLTPEIATKELPPLETPKENQSVVFQILYVNKAMCPTLSSLIYGSILMYKPTTETLAVDIPAEFIRTLFEDCDENLVLTDEIALVGGTGGTYTIHRSTLKNARLLM